MKTIFLKFYYLWKKIIMALELNKSLMKKMQKVIENIERKGVITPCNFTEDEFLEDIQTSEKGPFYAVEEAESILEQWKIARRSS